MSGYRRNSSVGKRMRQSRRCRRAASRLICGDSSSTGSGGTERLRTIGGRGSPKPGGGVRFGVCGRNSNFVNRLTSIFSGSPGRGPFRKRFFGTGGTADGCESAGRFGESRWLVILLPAGSLLSGENYRSLRSSGFID